MFRLKGRQRPSHEPLPADPQSGVTYVERYRGTEWDTGVGIEPRGGAALSALTGLLTGAILFGVLVTFWVLLGAPLP